MPNKVTNNINDGKKNFEETKGNTLIPSAKISNPKDLL